MNSSEQKVFVSTGAFQKKELTGIINCCSADEQHYLELSSGLLYGEHDQEVLFNVLKTGRFQFLVHNYFPIPEKHFVLNLASDDYDILTQSREHCRKAIRLSAELGAPFYSVHCGFCFHAAPENLGMEQTKLKRFPQELGYVLFVESLQILADFARQYHVDILIENNVLSPCNLIEGKNKLLLGVTADDIKGIFNSVSRDNIGLLLDVGHLKVSAKTLGQSPELFIRELAPNIRALHLSDNDGFTDSNQAVCEKSWFWQPLSKYLQRPIELILEVYKQPLHSINSQVALVKKKFMGLL